MKRYAAALLLALVPVAAEAETCTATTNFRWTAVGTTSPVSQWAGCTPTLDDTFVVSSGANVSITGDVTLNATGAIDVQGGILIVGTGTTLTVPGVLSVTGGTLQVEGAVVYEDRVAAITWGNYATGATVTMSRDASASLATTDYLLYGDDDADSASTQIRGEIQIGPGNPINGVYRPAFEKWKWYDITAISGAGVTYRYDEGGFTGSPYAGTRGPCIPTAGAATSITRGRFGLTSDVAYTTGTLATTGDCGEQYLEVTSGTCAGKLAKVVHTIDGGGGTDTFVVAGDLSACGATPDVRVTYGARAGDPFKIVRPATINGSTTGSIRWTAGSLKARYARFVSLGQTATTDVTPSLSMRCSVCIYQKSATESPASGSYITDSDLGYFTMAANSDQAAMLMAGLSSSVTTARYSQNILDMSGALFERIYVHDQLNAQTTSGLHGLVIEGVSGATVNRYRVERLQDDGAFILNNNMWSAVGQTPSATIRELLSYAQFSNIATSQQGIEATVSDNGTGTAHQLEISGPINVQDSFVTGSNDNTFAFSTFGVSVSRSVFGGAGANNSPASGRNWVGPSSGTFTNTAAGIADRRANRLRNSVVFGGGLITTPWTRVAGEITDTVFQQRASGGVTGQLYDVTVASGLFADLQDVQAGAPALLLSTGTTYYTPANLSVQDSALISTNAQGVCANYGNTTQLTSMLFRRLFLAFGTGYANGTAAQNCIASGQVAANGATFDAITATSTTAPSSLGANAQAGNGSMLTNICHVGGSGLARNTATVCGTSAADTCLNLGDTFPKASAGGSLRTFVSRYGSASRSICDSALPAKLGLSEYGPAHALMGDFANSQIELFSSADLIRAAGGGGGSLPRAF